MTDKLDDKKVISPPSSITQPVKLGSKLNSFHQQVQQGAKQAATQSSIPMGVAGVADMSTTVIFPDCSGSMSDIVGSGSKVDFCKDAVISFVDNCFTGATRVGVASFPEQVVVEPTLDLQSVKQASSGLRAAGGTPMAEPLDFVLNEWKPTHGIVISDGAPDSPDEVLTLARAYKEKGIKLDTVHIGDKDEQGESLMKNIATITGGVYIKFTDVNAFTANFKFLTPRHRLTLTTHKNPVALLGASEVKL